MQSFRPWIPSLLIAASAAAVLVCAFAWREELGAGRWIFYAASLTALLSLLGVRRRVTARQEEVETILAEAAQHKARLAEYQQELEKELARRAGSIDQRERALEERLAAYHEWMEFPPPQNLASSSEAEHQDIVELAAKDRKLLALLDRETEQLFENIKANKYSPDGKFDAAVLRHDANALIAGVAQIYDPNLKRPLLKTELEKVVRAAGRACLHFLVVLDGLPLDVKHYNIESLYGYVRKAVNAYKYYKAVQPYFSYASTGVYVGRFAMGANPLTLGAWWVLSELGKRGATAITQQVVNRQALLLLNNVVRLIGYEVATMCSSEFRYRDANWIFAAELTELTSLFPSSRESLARSLQEIGSVQLRNEYDRVFLYRCLASHRSAQPGRYQASRCLNQQERREVARRLEKFFNEFVHGKTEKWVDRWREGVEERLNLKLSLGTSAPVSDFDARLCALQSLAGFLIDVKQREPAEVGPLLFETETMRELSQEQRERLLKQVSDHPDCLFVPADLEPAGKYVRPYLADLARLGVSTAPFEVHVDEPLLEAAHYLRYDPAAARKLLQGEYNREVNKMLGENAPDRPLTIEVARALLDLLDAGGALKLVYANIELLSEEDPTLSFPKPLWLAGVGERLIVFSPGDVPQLHWQGTAAEVQLHKVKGYLKSECQLHGGIWGDKALSGSPIVVLSAPILGGFDAYFRALFQFCDA